MKKKERKKKKKKRKKERERKIKGMNFKFYSTFETEGKKSLSN